jgi:uncharacterized protein (TIGR02453 family)
MFNGFSQQTIDFLWGLRLNNERPWFEAHKPEYRACLEQPMGELARQVHAAMAAAYPREQLNLHICRIYRDARRLHGNGPYKDHLWFTLRRAEDPAVELPVFYFEVGPEQYDYGLGYFRARPDTMARFRARIDRDPKPMESLARRYRRQTEFTLEGERYARPKGDPGKLLEPWYNLRTLALSHADAPGGLLFQPQLAQRVKEGFDALMPFYRYLVTLPADPEP